MNHRGTENTELNLLSERVIGAAIEVHRYLGPGLLESAYDECLSHELLLRGVPYQRQVALPLKYKNVQLDCGYRIDFVVGGLIVVEVKSVGAIHPVHEAQLQTYLSLGGWKLGLLINFNVPLLRQGIRRRIL